MITPMENVNAGNIITSLYPLQTIGDVTLVLSLATLVIFVWLALRSRNIKSFQFQISIFIAFYLLGEIIESDRIAMSLIFPHVIGCILSLDFCVNNKQLSGFGAIRS